MTPGVGPVTLVMQQAGWSNSWVMGRILYYIHDPMCSWCWAFRPVWSEIKLQLPDDIGVTPLLGGLAVDSDVPMDEVMREKLQSTWSIIEERVPGTRFNYGFWSQCRPRRSTYPACRAVISARLQGEGFEDKMVHAIQRAYYLEARNPSDDKTLVDLAGECGLDSARFSRALNDSTTQSVLDEEIVRSQALNAWSFPSLVLETDGEEQPLQYDYLDPKVTLECIERLAEPSHNR